ncbi:SDR family oxidoreductase [Allomuricauda sp. CP2A]|jgi:NAD(P)-dependent dehydrogenase (short-subunit alcohol dehydrogenase family)|uniref:SDR family oxidoreductase n=1 Tax=Allomuricauda sp. CP2A TaxID=1848189 RepID=UPI00083134A7|nr:SDR family oxidoreductase [Muricauda sp. CP2A]
MNLELKDKVVIVTGGASGIGKGIVGALLKEGAAPCILDRDGGDVNTYADDLGSSTEKIISLAVELTDETSCRNAIETIVKKTGRIDALVNNAGTNDGVGLEKGSIPQFYGSLNNNVGHYFLMAKLCLPFLKVSKGTIVNIISKIYTTGQGGTSGYAAANGARASLTQDWAQELEKHRVSVYGVSVAECWTPQYKKWISQKDSPEEALKLINSKIPLENRMTTTVELADMTVFLLSRKSGVNSGQIVFVDGGYVHLDGG